jgi:hypothetical protein
MNLAIGTPALPYYAILDTGSDLTWTQCQPCIDCYTQPTPIYDPSHSSTYSKLPCQSPLCISDFDCTNASCEYDYSYADFHPHRGLSHTRPSHLLPNLERINQSQILPLDAVLAVRQRLQPRSRDCGLRTRSPVVNFTARFINTQ